MSGWDRRGTGGFLEELPALLVVLIAVSLFIASAAQAYVSHVSRVSDMRDRERVETFAGQLCSDEGLTWWGRLAMFSAASLSNDNITATLLEKYPVQQLGFDYNVSFRDASGQVAWSCASGVEAAGQTTISVQRACNIVGLNGTVFPALMTVRAWGCG
jgi:hypothetical protein